MLINCTVYQRGRKLASPALEDVGRYLDQSDTFVWIDLKDPDAETMAQMKMLFRLHELAVEDAVHGKQRAKVEEYDDDHHSLFVVMHLIDQHQGRLHSGEMHAFVGRNYLLSVRQRSAHDFAAVRARCERDPKMLAKGPGFVLYALMDAVVDRYFPLISKLEQELEVLEERIFSRGAARNSIRRLYRLKRKLRVLRHAVLPLQEATARLHGSRAPEVCTRSRHYFRDVSDHLARLHSSLDAVHDTIDTAIQVSLSMVSIDQTEISKRLAAWAGIFAVTTALAGIWGMNFSIMPELEWKFGYPLALSGMAGLAGLLYWRFRKAGWL